MLTTARCGLPLELLLGCRDWLEARAGEWPLDVSCLTPFVVTGGDNTETLLTSVLRGGMIPKLVPPKGFLDGDRGEDLSPFVVLWPLIPAFTSSCCRFRESLSMVTPEVLLSFPGFEATRNLILG